MQLLFEIINENNRTNNIFRLENKDAIIGRSIQSDWQLYDEICHISGKHILIEYKDGLYFLTDISTNGTFLKNPYKKLPKDIPIKINTNDIYIIGNYEIKVKFLEQEASLKSLSSFDYLLNNEKSMNNQMIIPDDDFLLEDSSVMNNSFIKEEKKINTNNFFDIYENNENKIFDILNSSSSLEEENYEDNIPSFDVLNEHLDTSSYKIETMEEGIECEIEDEIIEIKNSEVNNEILSQLEQRLGIKISKLSKVEQKKVIDEIVDIVLNTITGLRNSLAIKDKFLSDMNLEKLISNNDDLNPIKKGKNESLMTLLNTSNEVITISQAVKNSFIDLDNHNLVVNSNINFTISNTIEEFSPENVLNKLDKNSKYKSYLPKKFQIWDLYIKDYENLKSENSEIFNKLKNNYSREYIDLLNSLKTSKI